MTGGVWGEGFDDTQYTSGREGKGRVRRVFYGTIHVLSHPAEHDPDVFAETVCRTEA